jgi:DNA end-binding protein Ku
MYFADEVKNFADIPRAESQRVKQEALNLGAGLIDQMTNDEFDPDKYHDEYRERALELLEEKRKGHEITAPAEPTHKPAAVIDLMEALKRSISTGARTPARQPAGARAPARKAAAKSQRPKKSPRPIAIPAFSAPLGPHRPGLNVDRFIGPPPLLRRGPGLSLWGPRSTSDCTLGSRRWCPGIPL